MEDRQVVDPVHVWLAVGFLADSTMMEVTVRFG